MTVGLSFGDKDARDAAYDCLYEPLGVLVTRPGLPGVVVMEWPGWSCRFTIRCDLVLNAGLPLNGCVGKKVLDHFKVKCMENNKPRQHFRFLYQ